MKAIQILLIYCLLFSAQCIAEERDFEQIKLLSSKLGKEIRNGNSYERIEKISLDKRHYLITRYTGIAGVCGNYKLETFDYNNKLIDTLVIDSGCDSDGGESQQLTNSMDQSGTIGFIYNLKDITVENGYIGKNITKYKPSLYALHNFSGKFYEVDPYQYCNTVKYPELSKQKLLKGSVDEIPVGTLKLMRNEIFAKYGHNFKSKKLKEYFENCPWYKSNVGKLDLNITELEKHNIRILQQRENELKDHLTSQITRTQ